MRHLILTLALTALTGCGIELTWHCINADGEIIYYGNGRMANRLGASKYENLYWYQFNGENVLASCYWD